MRAFITGISGFVGAHLARVLASHGDQVAGVNRQGCWPADLVTPMREARIESPLAWDIADAPSPELRRFLADFRPEVLYHLAALSIPEDCGGAAVFLASDAASFITGQDLHVNGGMTVG